MPIFISSLAALLVATTLFGTDSLSIATMHAPVPSVADAPALSAISIEVRRGKKAVARLWLAARKDPASGPCSDRYLVNFCDIGVGSAVGIIRFLAPWRDYRDQEVPAATYVLRYAIQPRLKDHIGTTQFRDFLLLEPTVPDTHPFVMALVPAHSTSGPPALRGVVVEANIRGVRAGITFEGSGNLDPTS